MAAATIFGVVIALSVIFVVPIAPVATFAAVTASSASFTVVTIPSRMSVATTAVGPTGPTVLEGAEAVPEVLRATSCTYTGSGVAMTTVQPWAVSTVAFSVAAVGV